MSDATNNRFYREPPEIPAHVRIGKCDAGHLFVLGVESGTFSPDHTDDPVCPLCRLDEERSRANSAEDLAMREVAKCRAAESRLDPCLKALVRAEQALHDWVATFADDMCSPSTVQAAHNRIHRGGGSLAYIGETIEEISKARAVAAPSAPCERDVRCGNANCNALLSAGEPHIDGCFGGECNVTGIYSVTPIVTATIHPDGSVTMIDHKSAPSEGEKP